MSFFDSAFGGGAPSPLGQQQSPSAFTSPGMNPQALAMLMMMQHQAQQGGGMPGMAPGGMPGGGMPPGMGGPPPMPGGAPPPQLPGPMQLPQGQGPIPPGAGPQPQQAQLMQQLAAMDPNMLRQLLARLGLGGAAPAPGGAPGGMPGMGAPPAL